MIQDDTWLEGSSCESCEIFPKGIGIHSVIRGWCFCPRAYVATFQLIVLTVSCLKSHGGEVSLKVAQAP